MSVFLGYIFSSKQHDAEVDGLTMMITMMMMIMIIIIIIIIIITIKN